MGLFLLMATGCGSSNLATRAGHSAWSSMDDANASLVELRLREAEKEWHGTPYRYGGTTKDGIDCSAFVRSIYDDVFNYSLPRTTATQVETGQEVSLKALRTGDLVFFRTSRRARHVGIYLGNGEFAHASTSSGVMTSRLDDSYWKRKYWTSRRVLPSLADYAVPVVSTMPLKKVTPAPRTGW